MSIAHDLNVRPAGRGIDLAALARRQAQHSRSNVTSAIVLIRRRWQRRAPLYPVLSWGLSISLCLSIMLISLVVLDEPLAAFRGRWSLPLFEQALFWTHVGWSGWYLFPAALVLIATNGLDWRNRSHRQLRRLYAWTSFSAFVIISIGLSGALATVAKYVIGRARPTQFEQLGAFDFTPFAMNAHFASFPSGHSSTVGSVLAAIILFWPQLRFLAIPVAIWVASTRIVVGAHYPSDVAAGLAFGFAGAAATGIVFARLGYIFRQKANGLPEVKRTFSLFR